MNKVFGLQLVTAFLCLSSWAQRPDPIFLNIHMYDQSGSHGFEAGIGAKPLWIGKVRWMNSLTFRQTHLGIKNKVRGEEFHPTRVAYTSVFAYRVTDTWSSVAGISIANARADGDLAISSRSLFRTGFLLFSKPIGSRPNATWSIGLVFPDPSARIPVLPAVGLEYETESGRHQFRIAFPTISYGYAPSSTLRYGAFATYDFGAFLLQQESPLQSLGPYIRQERVLIAGFLKTAVGSGFWTTVSLGGNLWGRTTVMNDRFRVRDTLQTESGIYGQLGLSYRFD